MRLLRSSLGLIPVVIDCYTVLAWWQQDCQWPQIGWHHSFVIGWSKDRLELPSAPLHYGLKWRVGIPTVFQTAVTVPLHCNCLPLGLCKGTVKESIVVTHARAEAGGKLASPQIITCVHTCAVAERRRSGSKIRSARNGSNTQFAASASKPHAPNHHCPQEMADPPVSAPRMCEHTAIARLRSATAPRMCERSFTQLTQQIPWGVFPHIA